MLLLTIVTVVYKQTSRQWGPHIKYEYELRGNISRRDSLNLGHMLILMIITDSLAKSNEVIP